MYIFTAIRVWLLLLLLPPSPLCLWKVHYLQLLQNQSELAEISDGIYSIINAYCTNAVTHERLGNVLLSDPSTLLVYCFLSI